MKYTPKIHCLIPNPSDATALYRSTGVLSKLKHHVDCDFSFDNNVSWSSLAWNDILFCQRPWGKPFYSACMIAKNNNMPIWMDFDDYLLDVPEWNPAYKFFSSTQDKDLFKEMLNMSDAITVTTEHLKQKFLKFNPNVFIIPNAHNDYLFKFDYNFSKHKKIVWRGSNTHLEDFRTIVEMLRNLQSNELTDWQLNVIGDDPLKFKSIIKFKHYPPVDPIEYFIFIKELNPSIQLVPLVVNDFNKSKSNIAWIEGIYSGAVSIAPKDMVEFNRPGVFLYDDLNDFENILRESVKNPQELKQFYDAGFEFVKDKLLLSKVNELRKTLVERLMDLK